MSGVVGIKSDEDVSQKLYYSLSTIQHRGQDSAGVIFSDGNSLNRIKGMGLVNDVLSDYQTVDNNSKIGIGHVRSSSEGCNMDYNIEPLVSFSKNNEFSIAHDGNLVNYNLLKDKNERKGVAFHTHTDSELILLLITRYYENDIVSAIRKTMDIIKGAYSCILCMPDKIVAFRDYYGFRPLMIGSNDDTAIVASENPAIEILDIDNYRDIEAGEIVVIDNNGIKSYPSKKNIEQKHCIFESIYTARPDANIGNVNSYMFRRACGEVLYRQSPIDADLICPVPDSGTPSAIGFAQEAGIPFAAGLVKNRYMGRTFIKPSQKERDLAVKLKLNPQKSVIDGKRIVLVDDSIVRGTTSAKLIKRMRKAGAKEVHFRVSSPAFKYPCHYGIDTPDKDKLIASKLSIEEIRKQIGADSLEFISLKNMMQLVDKPSSYCQACFTGNYPIDEEDL
ncbi:MULTISPECIES: amidophosphoribosyltransferase [Anaerococcus]|uniref:Amidophosphoribosyltransferase n=2 Tax=Anaerococcus TaxID=165779 RepID=A0A3E2TK07_9FIRM|nr:MULTISPECIES: amidophosphoribosyltransferase [Anaerococcus]MBP2069454.1 amidophosphoribosyltransferase [Anaerococcus nagyae]MDU1829081.1 amidophosphoribosyltransferase [Anaerococcus sp.]MDU1864318.1 amidophosphoribosyltransferase [Anaerococcus sp.]MDU2565773.1 amidophosphoribosyltransferase [Anaerococcus sp.]RGB77323.1 amidophosphoribosyltransferase [Anaerococcus nagyae]